jgi:hypothetical protein
MIEKSAFNHFYKIMLQSAKTQAEKDMITSAATYAMELAKHDELQTNLGMEQTG